MWLMEIIKLSGQKWSVLTRQRRVDVIVGLILHCLLMAMYVLLVIIKRVVLAITFSIYTCVVRTATLLGLIRPVRLVGDVSRASHEGFACSSVQARSLECRKASARTHTHRNTLIMGLFFNLRELHPFHCCYKWFYNFNLL